MKKTLNAQRSTLNAQYRSEFPRLDVGRWTLDVGRWTFSVSKLSTLNSQLSTIPRFVWRIAEFLIGGVFIYAGAIKALDPVQFANDIDNYKILPWAIGVRLAFYLPWLEILCGLALIARRFYLGGLSILTALASVFIAATVAAKLRGLDITCGCFGHASKNWSFPQHMAVDLAILAGLLALWFAHRPKAQL